MAGETDLQAMLATLQVERRAGTYTVATTAEPVQLGADVAARIDEVEGTTVICTTDVADQLGLDWDFEAAWLTLQVHSALDAVGLTAAISTALTEQGISCNVLAGYFHDHLLVPVDRCDDAMRTLRSLARDHSGPADDS